MDRCPVSSPFLPSYLPTAGVASSLQFSSWSARVPRAVPPGSARRSPPKAGLGRWTVVRKTAVGPLGPRFDSQTGGDMREKPQVARLTTLFKQSLCPFL